MTPKMHDSGEREQFEDGAVRDSGEGKTSFKLISPFSMLNWAKEKMELFHIEDGPLRILSFVLMFLKTKDTKNLTYAFYACIEEYGWDRLSKWLQLGAEKYDERNWEKGMPFSRVVDSFIRHCFQEYAQEEDEDHGAAMTCNLMFLLHYIGAIEEGTLDPKWDDLPEYKRKDRE